MPRPRSLIFTYVYRRAPSRVYIKHYERVVRLWVWIYFIELIMRRFEENKINTQINVVCEINFVQPKKCHGKTVEEF